MKRTLLLVLIAYSLGVLIPATSAAALRPADQIKQAAAKKKKAPKHPKKKPHPSRPHATGPCTLPYQDLARFRSGLQ